MTERKMATIRRIDKIEPIPDADKIVKATVGGWQLVTAIDNEFKEGDYVVYCEIDSWIPTEIAAFLSKGNEPRVYNGVKGERLRTVKLRGTVSQGLLLPLSVLTIDYDEVPGEACVWSEFMLESGSGICTKEINGLDVSELLGIQKFEAEVPACLAGEVVGYFPIFIPKSDQERIQNLTLEYSEWRGQGLTWEESEKLEGSSMTVFKRDDEFGVCSRNLQLKRNPDNTLWKVALADKLDEVLNDAGNFALQGEIVGAGIQGNIYKFKDQRFYIYNIFDIDKSKFLTPVDRKAFVTKYNLKHVPVFKAARNLDDVSVEELLKIAEAKSVMGDITGPEQEGVVYKCNERALSFKVISNRYLLKNGG
jgi:RNA ligase (TIGR02306 family)